MSASDPHADPGSNLRAMVGRDDELARLARLLDKTSERARVVCVSGPSGVGKTAIARALLAERPGVFCSIENADSEPAVFGALSAALSVPLPMEDKGAREDRLVDALGARGSLLVVVDAAERAAATIDALVARIASRTPPSVTFLITSQLKLPSADHSLVLESLALPAEGASTREEALASPAVRLFLERAAAQSGLELESADVPHVVAIVRALDGLPLALLLGAARVGFLGVERTRELLARRFELLSLSSAPHGARHRSLEAAVGWSWELLTEPQRERLSAAAVFRGGFTLDAAHAVLGDPSVEHGELGTLRHLEELIAASMVIVAAPPAPGRGARFGLYESVREFARTATTPDRLERAERTHAHYFVSAARTHAARVYTADGSASRRWLAEELPNVVAAVRTLERDGNVDEALRGALALESHYLERGPVDEQARTVSSLVAALALESDSDPSSDEREALRARASTSLGLAAMIAGRRSDALAFFREATDRARRARADAVMALSASKAALLTGLGGDVPAALSLFGEASRLATGVGDPHLVGAVAKDRGMVLSEAGDNAAAIESFDRALAGFRAAGDAREEGATLAAIGARYLDDGALVDARHHVERALARLEDSGDQRTVAWSSFLLALVTLEENKLIDAAQHAERALALVRTVGDRLTQGLVLGVLGHIALEAGRLADATFRYRESAALLEASGDRRNLGIVLAAWSAAAAAFGERGQAARLLARAEENVRERGRPGDAETVALFAGTLLAREGEDAAARGDAEAARAALGDLAALIARVGAPDSAVHKSDELRFALRYARRVLAEATPRTAAMLGLPVDTSDQAPLVIAEDGSWFRLPSGEVTKLRGKPVAGRLLRTLALSAAATPGVAVPAAALIAAGWPGEKILPAAAANRLYVAMTRLRRLGIAELLRNEGDGYFLSPAVPVRFARDAAGAG